MGKTKGKKSLDKSLSDLQTYKDQVEIYSKKCENYEKNISELQSRL